MNKVIAGDYKNRAVNLSMGTAFIQVSILDKLKLNNDNVEEYEVIGETTKKSSSSAIGRATVGAFFLGPVGLMAGVGAKSKGTHQIAVQFKDGKRSLLEVDDKIYKAMMKSLF